MGRSRLKILTDHPLAAVIALGVIIRLLFLWEYYHDPQWTQLLVDSLFHDHWAKAIAGGDVLGSAPYFRAPFYIYVLGFIYFLSDNSLLIARLFGHAVGLTGVAATYLIAIRLFNKRTAVAAGIIHALYPLAIYYESELLVDSMFTTMVLYSILLFILSMEKRTARYFFMTGLLIGMGAITRAVILGMLPLYLLWYFIEFKEWKKSALRGLLVICGIIIPIIPVTVRNIAIGHDFVLIASSGGINFYIGNNENADGYSASLPPPLGNSWEIKDIKYLAEKETGHEMKASEISSFYYDKGIDWILHNPADFIALYFRKLKFAFNNLEISNNRNLSYFFQTNTVLRTIPLNFTLIFAFAIIGILSLSWNRENSLLRWFLPAYSVWYIFLIALFFINARFRLPIIPLLIIMGAYGVIVIFEAIVRGKFNIRTAGAVAAGVVAVVITLLPIEEVNKEDTKSALFNRANYQLNNGHLNEAIALYKRLLNQNRAYPDANLNLGAAYLKAGQVDLADRYFKTELRFHPKRAQAYSNLASVSYLRGNYQDCLKLADRALQLRPHLLDAHLIKMRTYFAMGDTLSLENSIREAESTLADKANLQLEAGIIYTSMKKYNRAIDYLESAFSVRPTAAEIDDNAFRQSPGSEKSAERIKARTAYQLGYIYGIQGNTTKSIQMSREAIDIDSNMAEAYINLFNAYNESGKPDSAEFILNLATAKFPENKLVRRIRNSRR